MEEQWGSQNLNPRTAHKREIPCSCKNRAGEDYVLIRRTSAPVRMGHEEETGKAKLTKAYNLPCRYILHTVGPIIRGELTEEDCDLLRQCYDSCLALAAENRLESVAFCCISTGEFHFPNDKAAQIAVNTVKKHMQKGTSVKKVVFNVFKDLDREIYSRLLG